MSLRFKRNYPIILFLVLIVSFLTLAMGDLRIIAYTVKAEGSHAGQNETAEIVYTNVVALFDDSVVHSIQIIMADEDYDEMITTYQETGLKEYFQADIIIDGVRVNDVGIRLKGNASLRTAIGGGGGGMGGGGRPQGMGQPPEMGGDGGQRQPPEMGADGGQWQPPDGDEPPQPPGNGRMPSTQDGEPANDQAENQEQDQAWQGAAPGGFGQAESGEVKIPFMVKFDEYIEGQTYQGYAAVAIRNYGTSFDAAMLQEPVTNDIVRLIGLPATQVAYSGFQINDEAESLYVISEVINEEYIARYFENSEGVLYKAEVGSTLSYEGEDPSSYADSFTQQTRVNDADLAPLIAFMRFLTESDEATFEAELPNYLDVDSFAAYLAVNNLLVNTDSIAGMNNNYYLYYDETTGRFTLLMWDANESLGKLGGGNSAAYDLYFSNQQGNRGPGGGGGFGGQNTLVTRFMASATFKALYEEKLKTIYEQAFLSGAMTEDVERFSALIHSVNAERNLVDLDSYDQAVQKALSFISQRAEYLSSTDLLEQLARVIEEG